ncbi:UROD/MetE-like protein [Boletus coccyginus]|nr:UROD/MetE-like protein [Boletus coccyginus]
MVPKQAPPFRAEHIGSLLRPDYLLQARKKFDRKEITQEQLRELEDQAIVGAVNMQREVGIKSFTDGEYRRHMFYDGFFEHLEGFEEVPNPPLEIFKVLCHPNHPLYVPDIHAFVANKIKPPFTTLSTSKIRYVKSGYIPQFEALKKLVHPDEVKNIKLTMVAPEWFHLRHGEHAFTPGVYTDREAYFDDIAVAYRQELEVLYAAGCRNIQIDDPLLAYFCDVSMLKGLKDEGEDADALLDAYIRLGGYDVIAVKLFNEVNVDCYYLEYDTERAGTFEPLKHLPEHKSVVLGLITSKFPELEDKALLRERVFDAARIVASGTGETVGEALQRIGVSPQCGFASHEEGNLLTADDMKKKLQLVKKLATSIWADA